MDKLPKFPLFKDPLGAGVFERSSAACAVCGRERGWVYTGPVYAETEEGAEDPKICPWCIADGTAAAELGCVFNDGAGSGDDLTPEDLEAVEQRTPGFITWQGNRWLSCCGRACVYRGEAKQGDLLKRGRWADAAEAILAEDGEDRDEDERAEILEAVGSGSTSAYIFQCLECGELRGYWDCD